jgi:alpha-mannosidase
MKTSMTASVLLLSAMAAGNATRATADGPPFVRLSPLPAPKITATADEYPGGAFTAAHLVDGAANTEFASNGKGTDTFVEFDFGAPVTIGAFRHVDRNDGPKGANIAASQLTFTDAAGKAAPAIDVPQVGQRAGLTMFVLPHPVTARRVRWQVTKLVNEGVNCAGGAEIAFFRAGEAESEPRGIGVEGRSELVVERGNGALSQPLTVVLDYPYGAPADVVVRVPGQEPRPVRLTFGAHRVTFSTPVVDAARSLPVTVDHAGKPVAAGHATLKPARDMTIYLLPHSHVDIGYTHRQADVEQRQWQNIETALELNRKTAGYPEGARFKWNTEVLWAVDSYLNHATPEKQRQFVDAVASGQIGLDALYGNELTGLCRPEELLRLLQWGPSIGKRCGVKVESAMISDVPGLTWGTVSACAQAGVRYFSLGINFIDGGRTLPAWEDRPFYWLGPDGVQKVLCWLPYKGYALGHTGYKLDESLPERLAQLDAKRYPYDVVQLRWNVGGDNGPPDARLPEVVKAWNARYARPRLVIATTAEVFRALEKKHADKIPVARGDFTPYWENGACSTARETALNRTAAERLVQAEALSSMLGPERYPAASFTEAWRNVILYDEHTWGAHNSITEPDSPFVKDQWKVKQAFALDADAQSRTLLAEVLGNRDVGRPTAVDVFNTSSWTRTSLVVLDKATSAGGDVVTGPRGEPVRSQRLTTGELAFLATDVPALAGRRYRIVAGKAASGGNARATGTAVGTPGVTVRLDPVSGAVASLYSTATNAEMSDTRSGVGLNQFAYVAADRVKEPKPAGPPSIKVKEAGPLVASLVAESDAPGCVRFSREVRVVDGLDQVDIVNVIDKKAVREKEAVHLGFAFNVPEGVIRMDIPWAVMRPEVDQIAGSCKNWFSVGRWVDISGADRGVTLATLDAPIVEVGAITDDKLGSTPDPAAWLAHVQPSQTVYSMVMNNHWHTNYKADQDGPTTFRYSLLPHRQYDPVAVQRFGIECGQPLVAVPARGPEPAATPLLSVDRPEVVVASLKPSADGQARIVRLFNTGARPAKAALRWGRSAPKALWISNLAEEPLRRVSGPVEIPASGLVTLRADLGS